MIQLTVVGYLGKDAEVKTVGDNKVINFSVAHTETYKDKNGEKQSKTSWVDCSQWVKSDAVAKYLTKGKPVAVSGEPSARAYKAADGEAKSSLCLRVEELQLIGGTTEKEPGEEEPKDDLPF